MACDTPGEFYIDDTKIDSLEIDDQEVDFLEIDGICVWVKLVPGRLILDEEGSYEWDILPGMTSVRLCMCGGGGGGSNGDYEDPYQYGGGFAGEVIEQEHTVTPNSTINIKVGKGADAKFDWGNGYAGEESIFDTITANGGAGGDERGGSGFFGNGEEVTTCGGTARNGYTNGHKGWGGESSGFGNGGTALYRDPPGSANHGGVGSGGGALEEQADDRWSTKGGRGEIRITWGDETNPLFHEYIWTSMTQEEKDKLGIRKV